MSIDHPAESIVVPLDSLATSEAKRQVSGWSKLFPIDALDRRRKLILPILQERKIDSAMIRQIGPSMGWGTALEVALRLLPLDLDEDEASRLDAAAVCLRICQGLAERRGRADSDLAQIMREATHEMLVQCASADVVADWLRAMSVLRVHDRVWSLTEAQAVATCQPMHVAFRVASTVAPSLDPWFVESAATYSALQWTAKDLSAAVGGTDCSVVGRITNHIALTSNIRARDRNLRPLVRDSIRDMDGYAANLAQLREAKPPGNSVHDDIMLYIETTIQYAARVYSELVREGVG